MTSVQNHLQQLNGNKIAGYFLLAALSINLLTGCFSSKKTSHESSSPKKLTALPDSPAAIAIHSDSIRTDTIRLAKDTLRLKKVYDVAVILPFNLGWTIPVDTPENYIDERSMLALEFYEGLLIALEELKKDSISLNLHIYDDAKDPDRITHLFKDTLFKRMDLIIGPIYNECLRVAARYAKELEIPLISPLSPSTTITMNNPYYLMAEPSIEVHCNRLFDYCYRHFSDKQFILIYQDNYIDKSAIGQFYEFLKSDSSQQAMIKDSLIFDIMADIRYRMDSALLDSVFSPYRNNIVILPSHDEAFVNHIINQISSYAQGKEITLIGMPSWSGFESLKVDQISRMNLFISTSYWTDPAKPLCSVFIRKYTNSYKKEPGKNAYEGYDLMKFSGKLLKKYGKDFNNYVAADSIVTLHTSYRFKPVMGYIEIPGDSGNINKRAYIDYYENSFVHVIKFLDYSWENAE